MKRNYLLCLLAITFSTKLLLSQTTFIGGPISIWTSESYLATPYPGTIDVSDLSGVITKITVTLNLSRLIIPDNIDILLVGPGGQNAIIMSDVGGSLRPAPGTIMLDDDAVDFLPDEGQLGPGTFKPTNIGGGDSWPSPAPSSLSGTSTLSVFNGTDPNGTWSLYVLNDGEIENTTPESITQWELNITVGGCANTYYQDNDNDGYGNAAITTSDCSPPEGYVSNSTDCNDEDGAIYPGAAEVCDDKDNNCNGQVDEGVKTIFYRDADGDSYGNADVTVHACSQPTGYILQGGDCNDGNAAIHPGGTEICNGLDDNCNGQPDEGFATTTYYRDSDGDGYGNRSIYELFCYNPDGYSGYVRNDMDCDDNDNTVYAGAPEICDEKDNDCDGQVDEGFAKNYFQDSDGDGYGNRGAWLFTCSPPADGYVTNNTDCDDTNPAVHPGATEVCNEIDDNCNFSVDELIPTNIYYRDADGDGYGNNSVRIAICSPTAPAGYTSVPNDCNDNDNTVYPGAPEGLICDGKDNDCDGQKDEDFIAAYYPDADGDTYGASVPGVPGTPCNHPAGFITQGDDCNDNDNTVYPGAPEICDGKDNDCDRQIDDNTVDPGVPEICDGKDNNCNGQVDEGVTPIWYQDNDNDGYGNPNVTQQTCAQPAGFIAQAGDCRDDKPDTHPGAVEICDLEDNDCDGLYDEGLQPPTWYPDIDGDGYGNSNVTRISCYKPFRWWVAVSGDCNDYDATIHPGAIEICGNIIDENCDGQIGEGCPGNPFIVIIPAVVYESEGVANLTVRLSKKSTKTIKVNYKTVNGTATSPADYTAKNGTVTIPPGSQTQTISVIIKNDNITEPTEYFTVKLSQPVNATIGLGTGIVGIRDGTAPSTTSEVPTGISDKANNPVQEQIPQKLTVNAYPNPSTNDFKIDVKSNSNEPVKITVTNASGIVVGVLTTSVQKQPVITVGKEWRGGTYFAEVVQGKDRKVLKLIKIN